MDDVLDDIDETEETFVCVWCGFADDIHESQCELADTEEFDLDSETRPHILREEVDPEGD